MSANVALTDTFDQWRVKTNEIVVMTQTDGMSNFIKVLDTTNSTSNTTGSIITAGGVGIAKSAVIGENLRVHGNLITDGDTTISGNLVFGDAATDQVTFSADINSSLIPNANNTFNVGNTTMLWANTWTGHLGVTQKSDSGKAAVAITSLDTDQIGISVAASQVDADVLDITSDAVTTAKVIDITADSLTTGSALYIDSDSSSTGTRSIASIIQNHASATGATGLTVQSDAGRGIFIDTNLAAGGYALEIDSEQTTTNVAKIASIATSGTIIDVAAAGALTGSVMTITADAATTGTLIETSADALTTGTIANFASDSSTTGTRTLVKVTNDNTAATGTTPLVVKQDSTNIAAKFDAQTAVAIPVGTTAQRGTAVAGGIRYNSTLSSFEGYSGSNWAGLGGLIDVDQDTKIIAETSAGADNDDLDFYTAGTQRMKIDQAGVVTVGVDDAGYDVKLFGDTAGKYWMWDTSADGTVQVGNSQLTGTLTVGVDDTGHDVKLFGATASKYWLWDESADKMIIAGDAAVTGTTTLTGATQQTGTLTVGINDTGHDVKFFGATAGKYMEWDESADQLDVTGSFDVTGNSTMVGTLTVGVDDTGHDVKFFGDTASKYWLWDTSADGTVLVGSSTQTGNMQLTGTLTVGVDDTGHDVKFFGATASKYCEWDESADTLTIAGTLTESSMRELKDNIEPIENILPAVLQMQGVKFDWKEGTKDNYGFIAEEVAEVLPHLVSHDDQGKVHGVQYSKMTAVLLEAIKEQQVQIDELKAKLN
jgi:hypothetical protein